jgi:hypothetical protein
MMDKFPDLAGLSHGGGGTNSQARTQSSPNSVNSLDHPGSSTENEATAPKLAQKKSCSIRGISGKGLFNSMPFHSFSYWFACSVTAVIAVSATEPDMAPVLDFNLPEAGLSSVLPVPEPSRAFLLFAGIMAMAFTYRRAWLNWKRSSQP